MIKKGTISKKQAIHLKQLEALSKVSKAITSDLYLEDILRLIVMVTAQVMNSKICSLMLLDEEKEELRISATQSISEEYLKKPNLKVGEGIAGKVAKEKRPITVADVTKEKGYKYRNIAKKEGLHSLLSVPLMVKGKIIGVLNTYTSFPHKFTKNEMDVLTTVANQAAIAIENTHLLVESKVIKEELEARKVIEKAKGVLMKEEDLTEEEAYNRIRRYSMDNRKRMQEVSEAIILSKDLRKS